jgi:hypothetical protein
MNNEEFYIICISDSNNLLIDDDVLYSNPMFDLPRISCGEIFKINKYDYNSK